MPTVEEGEKGKSENNVTHGTLHLAKRKNYVPHSDPLTFDTCDSLENWLRTAHTQKYRNRN